MKIVVDGRAWLKKEDLNSLQISTLKEALTIIPRKMGDDPPTPIEMWVETDDLIGIPRGYFEERKRATHEIDYQLTDGDKSTWPGDLSFDGTLRPAQQTAMDDITEKLVDAGLLGGILKAVPGFGKTVCSAWLIAKLNKPTLIIVHKEFLRDQWIARLEQFLPGIKIGICQQDRCEFEGNHVVIGMVHSLTKIDRYPEEFKNWPGLVITDEMHRIGAPTWAPVPSYFPARHRFGVSATPKRKDGADNVFYYNIGRVLHASKEQRMTPKIRRVWTNFNFPKSKTFNPNSISRSILLNILLKSKSRNDMICEQLELALKAGRKVLVLSERLEHLRDLEARAQNFKVPPTIGWYVGGVTPEQRKQAEESQLVLATVQYAAEGMDIPPLDTLFITTPMSDVEQAVGRILRPYDGKKPPVVVDIRDDKVARFRKNGRSRDAYYKSIGANV